MEVERQCNCGETLSAMLLEPIMRQFNFDYCPSKEELDAAFKTGTRKVYSLYREGKIDLKTTKVLLGAFVVLYSESTAGIVKSDFLKRRSLHFHEIAAEMK